MPSWPVHIKVAGKIADNLNIYDEKNKFMIGNVLPDMYGGYIVKNVSKILEYEESHYREMIIINGGKFYLPGYETFKNVHLEVLDDKLILGYFTHLMTDYYFNKYTYKNKFLIDDTGEVKGIKTKRGEILNCGRKTAIRMKQEDFNSFSDMLDLDRYNFSYNSDIFNSLSKLKAFEVESEDIIKVINYLNSLNKKEQGINKPLILFSKDELNDMVEECSNFIIEYIKNSNIMIN